MPHDVFISYSSKNKIAADAVCEALEGAGIRCWIAPRDTDAGAYGPSIIRAIKGAKACVLVLSEEANSSPHVLRELERAVNAKLPIVPFRLAPVVLSDDMEYYIASQHWVDGFPEPFQARIPALVERMKARLAGAPATPRPAAVPDEKSRVRSGLAGRIERIMVVLSRLPPPMTALVLILLGMVVNGLSLFIGVGDFSFTLVIEGQRITKEVGFLSALNWSLGALLIAPLMVGFGLHTYRALPQLFEQLARRRMVVDEFFHPVSAEAIKDQWRGHARTIALISAFAFATTLAYTAWEYWTVIGDLYAKGAFPAGARLADPYYERDWSVAALLGTPEAADISKTANALFSLFVYVVYVGLVSGFALSVFAFLLGVASFIYALAHRGQGLQLVPDLRGTDTGYDRRAGLQVFEPLIQSALFVALLAFLLLFLIHLQNIYLRAPQSDILTFALPAPGQEGGAMGWLGALVGAATARVGLANLNSALAYGFGSFLFIIVIVILAVTLRMAAQRSRASMTEHLADDNAELPGWLEQAGREKCRARLAAMTLWPARWPKVNQLALTAVVAGVCLIFYKVGLIVVVAGLVLVGYRLVAMPAARRA